MSVKHHLSKDKRVLLNYKETTLTKTTWLNEDGKDTMKTIPSLHPIYTQLQIVWENCKITPVNWIQNQLWLFELGMVLQDTTLQNIRKVQQENSRLFLFAVRNALAIILHASRNHILS